MRLVKFEMANCFTALCCLYASQELFHVNKNYQDTVDIFVLNPALIFAAAAASITTMNSSFPVSGVIICLLSSPLHSWVLFSIIILTKNIWHFLFRFNNAHHKHCSCENFMQCHCRHRWAGFKFYFGNNFFLQGNGSCLG
jgi:hypothetical protein